MCYWISEYGHLISERRMDSGLLPTEGSGDIALHNARSGPEHFTVRVVRILHVKRTGSRALHSVDLGS